VTRGPKPPRSRYGTKRVHFIRGQFPPLSRLQPAIFKRTDVGSAQHAYRMAHSVAHPSHLSIPSFANRQPQHALPAAARIQQYDVRRESPPTIERNALPQPFERLAVRHSRDACLVGPFDAVSRMR